MTEVGGAPFTRSDQATLEPGWYWIRRCEPDGPPVWEIALFVRWDGGERWDIAGTLYPGIPTSNPNASNAWRIGPRIEKPTSLLDD